MQTYYAPAKINLGLQILYRYANGYHHIVSPVLPVSFGDTLQVELLPSAQNGGEVELSWKNLLPSPYNKQQDLLLPFSMEHKQKNLVVKAAAFFYEWLQDASFARQFPLLYQTARAKILPFSPHVRLQKKVPSPCGLGGGSSDAAALLRFLSDVLLENIPAADNGQSLYGMNTTNDVFNDPSTNDGISGVLIDDLFKEKKKFSEQLLAKSVNLGADVPLFLSKGNSLIEGIGLTSLLQGEIHLAGILGIPPFGFATTRMYKALKKPLQHEYASNYSHANVADDYRVFWQLLQKDVFFDNLQDAKAALRKSSVFDSAYETKNMLFLRNDFWQLAHELFSKEASAILEKMHCAAEVVTASFQERVVIGSLSGSGSAFYVFVPFCVKEQEKARLSLVIENLKKKHPSFFWTDFFSIHWAVAKW